jgi:diguanylate cyclase (GGDEF)-like protein
VRSRYVLPPAGSAQTPAGTNRAQRTGGLIRVVATSPEQARFWVRHTRIGVALTGVACVNVLVYAFTTHGAQRDHLLVIAALTTVLTPGVLLMPIARIAQHRYGICFFYGWSASCIAVLAIGAAWDGGTNSELTRMFFLPLAYAAMAYPALGVALCGAGTLLAYAGLALSSGVQNGPRAAFDCGVLFLVTTACAFAARYRWQVQDEQDALTTRLAELADVDGLTGCLNQRAFGRSMDEHCTRTGVDATTALIIIDLDHFKQVNDNHGHIAGDMVLGLVAEALRHAVRADDLVARIGGDEFAVIAPGLRPDAAQALADRCRRAIEQAAASWQVTGSVGVAAVPAPTDPVALYELADRASYEAKRAGRNRTVALTPAV